MVHPSHRNHGVKVSHCALGAASAFVLGLVMASIMAENRQMVLKDVQSGTSVLQVLANDNVRKRTMVETEGWKQLHVFFGKEDHLKIETPMAQAKQDEYVVAMLGNKQYGYFVDLAANDATYLSNTYILERDHGWSGLCIEPNPSYWRRLSYRRCEIVAAVVGSSALEEIEFHLAHDGALGGIAKTGFENNPNSIRDKSKLASYYTVTMPQILERMNAPALMDYLSLDIEGAELYVMQHFPFEKYAFRIMTVERPATELSQLLNQNGYKKLCTIATHGETLWVLEREAALLDLSTLPAECRSKKK